jgi:hypothetical protein
MAALPNLHQQHKVRVARNPEVLQIQHRLLSAACRNGSFPRQAPQDLRDLKIQKVRSMEGFVPGINALFNVAVRQAFEEANLPPQTHPEQSPRFPLLPYHARRIELHPDRLALVQKLP